MEGVEDQKEERKVGVIWTPIVVGEDRGRERVYGGVEVDIVGKK